MDVMDPKFGSSQVEYSSEAALRSNSKCIIQVFLEAQGGKQFPGSWHRSLGVQDFAYRPPCSTRYLTHVTY